MFVLDCNFKAICIAKPVEYKLGIYCNFLSPKVGHSWIARQAEELDVKCSAGGHVLISGPVCLHTHSFPLSRKTAK